MAASDPWKDVEASKEFDWYIPNLEKGVTPEIRRRLEDYSKIPSDEVVQHIHDVRDKAWVIRPYPCTGLGTFLQPMISKSPSPAYPKILSLLKQGGSFVDVGCFLGQDIRNLVFDGTPSDNLYGIDVVDFWDLGYELFRDKDKFSAHFIEADILNPNPELLALHGKIDVISAMHVLHQWNWETQIVAAKQLCALSKPSTLIVGYQIGTSAGANKISEKGSKWGMQQDVESWGEMWDIVGEGTGTEWKSEASLRTFEEMGLGVDGTDYLRGKERVLEFVVTRLQ